MEKITFIKNQAELKRKGFTTKYDAFVRFKDNISALFASIAIDKFKMNGKIVRASLGFNKFCT